MSVLDITGVPPSTVAPDYTPSNIRAGVPLRSRQGRIIVFDYLPTLRDLLPQTDGRPGVAYAQVCLHNIRHVLADKTAEWCRAEGIDIYTIRSSKGEAEMMLACIGKPIPNQDTKSGKRICWFDADITTLTGYPTPADFTTTFKGPRTRSLLEEQPNAHQTQVPPQDEGAPGTPLAEAYAQYAQGSEAEAIAPLGQVD